MRYQCQATGLFDATAALHWWDPRQYLWDVTSGNHSLRRVAKTLWLALLGKCLRYTPFGYRLVKRVRERMHRWLTGRDVPDLVGRIPRGEPTPTGRLGLEPGDRVRVKSKAEIGRTLNQDKKNRGLWFDAEMLPYCGRIATVRRRVTKIIDERSGEMRSMKEPCLLLEGVVCNGDYSEKRLLCPRALPAYWREVWLEREGEVSPDARAE